MTMMTLTIIVVVICVGYFVASSRKALTTVEERPERILSFTTSMDIPEIAKAVVRFAQTGGYDVEEVDPRGGRVVLGERPSATTWGFFYPVYLTEKVDGKTQVEVGIKSRLVQYGPLVDRSHERLVNGLKAFLYSEDAPTYESAPSSKPAEVKKVQTRDTNEAPNETWRFCTECGTRAGEQDRFCASCGKRLG